MQKDYKFDAGFFGSLNEFSKKVAYFFHASLQGTACYQGTAEALRFVQDAGLAQGLLADGQCFTIASAPARAEQARGNFVWTSCSRTGWSCCLAMCAGGSPRNDYFGTP